SLHPGSFPVCVPACLSCQPARLAWPLVSLACLPTNLVHSTWAPLLFHARHQSSSSSIPYPCYSINHLSFHPNPPCLCLCLG
ncbi:hypothetical protein AAFF_G00281260, partial [Aldrovandia affinis]